MHAQKHRKRRGSSTGMLCINPDAGIYQMLTTRLELRIAMIAAMKNVLSPISDNKIMPHDLRNACARMDYPFQSIAAPFPARCRHCHQRQCIAHWSAFLGCSHTHTYLDDLALVKGIHGNQWMPLCLKILRRFILQSWEGGDAGCMQLHLAVTCIRPWLSRQLLDANRCVSEDFSLALHRCPGIIHQMKATRSP